MGRRGSRSTLSPRILASRTSQELPTGTAALHQPHNKDTVQPDHPPVDKVPEAETKTSAVAEYTNSRFGFSVRYPQGVLFPQGESANGDGQVFSSADSAFVLTAWGERRSDESSIEELFAYESRGLAAGNPRLVVTYKRHKGNWFVVSGNEGSVGVYRRVQLDADRIVRLEMRWPVHETERWRSTVEQVSVGARKRR